MPTAVKKMQFGQLYFPTALYKLYMNYVADLGNDFLPNDIGPRKRIRERCANARKTLIKRGKFFNDLKTCEERAIAMSHERISFVKDNIVRTSAIIWRVMDMCTLKISLCCLVLAGAIRF